MRMFGYERTLPEREKPKPIGITLNLTAMHFYVHLELGIGIIAQRTQNACVHWKCNQRTISNLNPFEPLSASGVKLIRTDRMVDWSSDRWAHISTVIAVVVQVQLHTYDFIFNVVLFMIFVYIFFFLSKKLICSISLFNYLNFLPKEPNFFYYRTTHHMRLSVVFRDIMLDLGFFYGLHI